MRTLSITEADTVAGGVAGGYGWVVVYQAGGHSLSGGNSSNTGSGGRDNETGGSCTPRLADPQACKNAVEDAMIAGAIGGAAVGYGLARAPGALLVGAVGGLAGLAYGVNSSACQPVRCPAGNSSGGYNRLR